MINVALVGCAHIHTPGFVKTLQAQHDAQALRVKYVWDPDKARAEKRAADLNCRVDSGGIVSELPASARATVTTNVKKVFADPEVTAVVICSQTNLHKKLVLQATAARKHLFVEKPLGMGAKDAAVMGAAIAEAGVVFQTGYFTRGDGKFLFVREQIAKGSFGKITHVRGSNCHSGALGGWFDAKPQDPANDWRWMADPKIAGCGAFGDLGTHYLDILMWLLGDIDAVAARIDPGTARYPGCDELGEALIKFRSGVIGTLAAGWVDVADPVRFLLSGTEGHAAIIHGQLYFVSKKVEGADGKQPWTALPANLPHAFAMFLSAAGGVGGLPLVTAQEAAARSSVMEAMYKAASNNKWVTVAAEA
jgi:predicted dehydrogenase